MPVKKHRSSLQQQLTMLLYNELKRQKMSQAELGRRANVSSKHICHIMTGEQAGSIMMWSHLFETLGIRIWQPERRQPDA